MINKCYREFSNERLRVERRAKFHKTRSKKQFNESFGRYIEWITRAGEINYLGKANAK